jgi:ribosome maturation factor RimP
MTVAEDMNEQLQTEIEKMLRDASPDVEVVLAEQAGPGLVRVVIDHPELSPIRDRYALEVSSPGVERPLMRPQHYQRVVGKRVDVRTVEPIDGRRHFTARLADADDAGIDLDQDGQTVRIGYDEIRRGRLVFDSWGGRS